MKSYQNLLQHIIDNGESHDDRTGVGTISVFGHQWRHNLQEGFPLLTTKKVPFRWVAAELFWFLSGSTKEQHLRSEGVDIWKEWADEDTCRKFGRSAGNLGPIYGFQWRNFGGDYDAHYSTNRKTGFDQIKWICNEILENPNSRRLIVSGWNPKEAGEVSLPPCHTLFQFKVHNESELSCHLYARSIDAFLGLPFNIASYALLTHIIAEVSELKVRDLIISFGDLHIYKNHLDAVKEQLSREPRELPTLEFEDDGEPKLKGFEGLNMMSYRELELLNYNPHPKISAPVAV